MEVRLTDDDGRSGRPARDRRPGLGGRAARTSSGGCCSSAPGDPYLETALTYLPDTELYGVTLDKYGPPDRTAEQFDLIIFEGALPDPLPSPPILAIAPPKTSRARRR